MWSNDLDGVLEVCVDCYSFLVVVKLVNVLLGMGVVLFLFFSGGFGGFCDLMILWIFGRFGEDVLVVYSVCLVMWGEERKILGEFIVW